MFSTLIEYWSMNAFSAESGCRVVWLMCKKGFWCFKAKILVLREPPLSSSEMVKIAVPSESRKR